MGTHQSLAPSLTIGVKDVGTTRIIALSGEIDIVETPRLRRALDGACREPSCEAVLVDLSGVSFIETTGLTALHEAFLRSQQGGMRIVLHEPSERVRELFQRCTLGGELTAAMASGAASSASERAA